MPAIRVNEFTLLGDTGGVCCPDTMGVAAFNCSWAMLGPNREGRKHRRDIGFTSQAGSIRHFATTVCLAVVLPFYFSGCDVAPYPAISGQIACFSCKDAKHFVGNLGILGCPRSCRMPDPRIVRMSMVNERRREFLWEDRIVRGGINLLDGDPGKAKSSIAYDLVARITRGDTMPLGNTRRAPAGAVILQGEDCLEQDIRPSLRAARADLHRVFACDRSAMAQQPITFPGDISTLENAIREISAALVVIDPVSCFVENSLNNEQGVRRALGPLNELAGRLNIAVLLIRHLNKSGRGNPLYRGLGSIGISAIARSCLIVGDDPTSTDPHQHVLADCKGNRALATSVSYRTIRHHEGTIILEWIGMSNLAADEIIAAMSTHKRSALEEAVEVLRVILSDGPVPANDVARLAKNAQVAKRTLDRAKRQLGVRSLPVRTGMHAMWVWELPDETASPVNSNVEPPAPSGDGGPAPPAIAPDEWRNTVLTRPGPRRRILRKRSRSNSDTGQGPVHGASRGNGS